MFWMCTTLDERFNYKQFQNLPLWLLKQGYSHKKQQINIEQSVAAKILQCYINSHIDTNKTKAISEESGFLPYPIVWKTFTQERRLKISKQTAREVLKNYQKLPSDYIAMLDEYYLELQMLVN